MKKKIYALFIVLVLSMALGACSGQDSMDRSERVTSNKKDKDKDKDKDEDDDKDKDKPTVVSDYKKSVMMVYIVGSNLESEGGYATADIKEMKDSGYDESLMDIYLCTGGASAWSDKNISAGEIAIWKLESGKLNKLDTISSKMTDSNTLQTFIDTVYADTDGDCYNLVLWNHGGGAILGYGVDETDNNNAMTMMDIEEALSGTKLIADGNKFEVVGFDACLMGMLEIADTLDEYSNYLLASEEVEPGRGWDYSCLGEITNGGDFTGVAISKVIIDAYAEYYKSQKMYKPEYSLACMDLSKTDDVIDSFEGLVASGITELSSGNYSSVAKARSDTKSLGRMSGVSVYDCVDLYNLAENMAFADSLSSQELKDSIDDFVVYFKSNIQRTHGVAVYMPYDNKVYVGEWIDIYKDLDFSDEYITFLEGYVATLTGESLADWNVDDVVAQQNPNMKSEYSIQLSPDQAANYAKARVTIWEKDEDDHDMYLCVMATNDVTLEDDGTLVANYYDDVFYLSNGAGEEISFTIFESERSGDEILYYGTLYVSNYEDIDNWKNDFAEIIVRVDPQHPTGEIVSINEYHPATDDNMFPQSVPYQFEDGDSISGTIFNRMVSFNDDGSVAPFDEWTSPYYMQSPSIDYDGEWSCEFRQDAELEEGSYFCLFSIGDTQGNIYYTGPFVAEDRITSGAYFSDNPDSSLTSTEPYDDSTGKVAIFDNYNEQVVVIDLGDKYDYNEKLSYSRKATLKEKNDNGKYVHELVIEDGPMKIVSNYLKDGTMPDSSNYPNFYCDISKKKATNYEVWIITYNIGSTSYKNEIVDAVIPYLNCYGDQCFLSIQYDDFENMTEDEIVEYIESVIK